MKSSTVLARFFKELQATAQRWLVLARYLSLTVIICLKILCQWYQSSYGAKASSRKIDFQQNYKKDISFQYFFPCFFHRNSKNNGSIDSYYIIHMPKFLYKKTGTIIIVSTNRAAVDLKFGILSFLVRYLDYLLLCIFSSKPMLLCRSFCFGFARR